MDEGKRGTAGHRNIATGIDARMKQLDALQLQELKYCHTGSMQSSGSRLRGSARMVPHEPERRATAPGAGVREQSRNGLTITAPC